MNIEKREDITKITILTLPLVELKKVVPSIPEVDEDEFEDPLWEQIKWLWTTTSENVYQNGNEVRDLLDTDMRLRLKVEMENGDIEDYRVFDHS